MTSFLVQKAQMEKEEKWPVYKGESFNLWNPDTGENKYYAWANYKPVIKWLYEKRINSAKIKGSIYTELAQDYLQDEKTLPCYKPRIAFRAVTNATNRRTFIACLIPGKVFLCHLAPYLLWTQGNEIDQAFLIGVLSSIPLDWYARRQIEAGMEAYKFNSLPIPDIDQTHPLRQRTIKIAGRLSCPDIRFENWAKSVGVECGPLKQKEKSELIYELDAVVAHMYGLCEHELIHILESFKFDVEDNSRIIRVIRHYRSWKKK